MKYIKMLGLLAVAAAALMAFAGPASATELTKAGKVKMIVNELLKAESEGETKLDGAIDVACKKSTVEGKITNAGAPMGTVVGALSALTFTECGSDTVTVLQKGSLEVHNTGGETAQVTSTGAEVTVQLHRIIFFIPITTHCIYATNNTVVGTLTGTGHVNNSTKTATLDIGSAAIPQKVTDSACGDNAEWTGSYAVTAPDELFID